MRASILQKCHLAKIMVHLFRMAHVNYDYWQEKRKEKETTAQLKISLEMTHHFEPSAKGSWVRVLVRTDPDFK